MANAKGCLVSHRRTERERLLILYHLAAAAAAAFESSRSPSSAPSSLIPRAPLPFQRDPRPPSVRRQTDGRTGRTMAAAAAFRNGGLFSSDLLGPYLGRGRGRGRPYPSRTDGRPHLPAAAAAAAADLQIPSVAFHISVAVGRSVGLNSKGAVSVLLDMLGRVLFLLWRQRERPSATETDQTCWSRVARNPPESNASPPEDRVRNPEVLHLLSVNS